MLDTKKDRVCFVYGGGVEGGDALYFAHGDQAREGFDWCVCFMH